ncbi:MAG: nucleoside-triphosphatase [Anaerolineales bacterium]
MGKTLLLTGHPGIGKTTIIKEVLEKLGARAGGFYTQEISGPGGRKGFELITLDGKRTILAHKELRGRTAPRVGRYGVDVKALDRVGVRALRRAMEAGKVVVVDEIGRMELFSPTFQTTVMEAILGPNVILGTILLKPHPHADLFKSLAPVTVWEVEERNRKRMAQQVVAWLREAGAL